MEIRTKTDKNYYKMQYIPTAQNNSSKRYNKNYFTYSNTKKIESDSKPTRNNNANPRNYSRNEKVKKIGNNKNSSSVPKNHRIKKNVTPMKSFCNETKIENSNSNTTNNFGKAEYIKKQEYFRYIKNNKNNNIEQSNSEFSLSLRNMKSNKFNKNNDNSKLQFRQTKNKNENINYLKFGNLRYKENDGQLVYLIHTISGQLNQLNKLINSLNKNQNYYNNKQQRSNKEINSNEDNINQLINKIFEITEDLDNYNKRLIEIKNSKSKNYNNDNNIYNNPNNISFNKNIEDFYLNDEIIRDDDINIIKNNFANDNELNNLKEERNKYKNLCLILKKNNDILTNNNKNLQNNYDKLKNAIDFEMIKKNEDLKYCKHQYDILNKQFNSYKLDSKESYNNLLKENNELKKKIFILNNNIIEYRKKNSELDNIIQTYKNSLNSASDIISLKKSNNSAQSKNENCQESEIPLNFTNEQKIYILQQYENMKDILNNNKNS